jgi:PAS domain-containing protein
MMEEQDRKRIILTLRWTAIIVTSYLILFGRGRVTDLKLSHLLIAVYLLSNVLLTFLPKKWFSNSKFFYPLVIFDTGIVSFGMYLSEKMTTDFYLVFFLIIIFASISRNFKLLMVIGGITALLYGVLLYSWGLLITENGSSYTLRVPFIFIMTAFYGYIVQTLTKEKHQELTISEDKYRGLFENANEGIIILRNPQWQIADVNREVERASGFTKEELIQKEFLDLFTH